VRRVRNTVTWWHMRPLHRKILQHRRWPQAERKVVWTLIVWMVPPIAGAKSRWPDPAVVGLAGSTSSLRLRCHPNDCGRAGPSEAVLQLSGERARLRNLGKPGTLVDPVPAVTLRATAP
jgi:hypothetical protein